MYKDSQNLYSFCFELTKKLPNEYRFELSSQLLRSSSSIALNIAEGSAKGSHKDFSHFLDIALGSLYETVANVDMLRLSKLVEQRDFDLVSNMAANIAKQLGGFKKKLKS
ncbi:four helix bundle protein [Candidatus Parcubacteria bacterium]|nr:four helix bundle protein [Candidatus Parcubacteria bacterium]